MKKRSIIFWDWLWCIAACFGMRYIGGRCQADHGGRDAVAEKLIANWNQYDISFTSMAGRSLGLSSWTQERQQKTEVGSNWTKITSSRIDSCIQRGRCTSPHVPMLSSLRDLMEQSGICGDDDGKRVYKHGGCETMDIMRPETAAQQ